MNLPSVINESSLTYEQPSNAIFLKSRRFEDIKYDTERGLHGDYLATTWRLGPSPAVHHLRCITFSASPAVHHQRSITCSASPAEHHLRRITCGVYVRGGKASKERENCFIFALDFILIFVYERGGKALKERENCFIFALDFILIFVYERGGKALKERENCFIFASNLINIWVRIFY